jgi:hypothetical protein
MASASNPERLCHKRTPYHHRSVAQDLPVDYRIAAGPPEGDSHQRRDDQDGDDTGEQATDRGCIQFPARQVVVVVVMMSMCHRGSLRRQG